MVTSIVLVVTAFITPALAWDKEYEGFAHFHNWDGLVTDLQQQVKFPDGSQIPVEVSKDYCGLDSKCNAFGGKERDGRYFRTMNSNASYDLYIAVDSTVLSGDAICKPVAAGCNSQQQWLACDNDRFDDWSAFSLPPDVMHSTCTNNPSCVGFKVANDGSKGMLIQTKTSLAPGWFAYTSTKIVEAPGK